MNIEINEIKEGTPSYRMGFRHSLYFNSVVIELKEDDLYNLKKALENLKKPLNDEMCLHEKKIQDYLKYGGHDYCTFCGGEFPEEQ
jgi:hypothetical protein